MNVHWSQVRPSFNEIGWPDFGGHEQWDRWFAKAWEHLGAAGLASYGTPLDGLRVRMRVFALCWLAHDFCEAAFGEGAGGEPYWIDWLDEVGVDRSSVLVLAGTLPEFPRFLEVIGVDDRANELPIEEVEDISLEYDDSQLVGMAAAFVGATMRREIVQVLHERMGGASELLASMWETAHDWTHVRDEAEEHLHLEGEALERHVSEEARRRLFEDPLLLVGDPDTAARMSGWEWVNGGCPIVVQGYPSYPL